MTQDSIDAEGFRDACRHAARLAEALGLGDYGHTIGEVVDTAIDRLSAAQPERSCPKHPHWSGFSNDCPSCHPEGQPVSAPEVPAMCRCPDTYDCDGRFVSPAGALHATHRCELVVGHEGTHHAGGHNWLPAPEVSRGVAEDVPKCANPMPHRHPSECVWVRDALPAEGESS